MRFIRYIEVYKMKLFANTSNRGNKLNYNGSYLKTRLILAHL